jgi:tRNA (mo5U34)-methyltransferase
MKTSEIKKRIRQARSISWFHSFEVIKGSGVYTPGWVDASPEGYEKMLANIKVNPKDLKGKRVLDIGTSSGAFAFYLEDSGADVLAVDVCAPELHGFRLVHEIRESGIEFRRAAVYDLNPDDFGYFDIVVFFGVFYHLKHPLLAFERINSICKEGALLIGGGVVIDRWYHDEDESCERGVNLGSITRESIDNKKILNVDNLNELPLCGFSSGQFLHAKNNWFIPNSRCVLNWLETSGFKIEAFFKNESRFPLHRKAKDIFKSGIKFKASKVGPPEPENPYLQDYKMPTSLELERASREIKRLKAQLKKYETAV